MSTNDPSPEVTSQSNVVTITDESNTITSIVYLPASLDVSEGQPHDAEPSIARTGNVFTITLEAGRHKTAPVAETFNARSGGQNNEYAPFKEIDETPDELNFFFGLQITFEFASASGFANVYLGQGHVLGVNNWWIGSPNISNFGEPQLVYTADLHEVSLALSGTHDSFNLRQVDVRKLSPIQHVFVLMLENHSFDNMLAMSDIPGIFAATTKNSNSYESQTYNVTDGALSSMPAGPGHEFTDVLVQLCGLGVQYNGGKYPQPITNSGFVANYATTVTEPLHAKPGEYGDVMGCFNSSVQLPILYELASQFAVCDQWFSSLPGPTWPNRFFVHGASSNGLDHSPSSEEIIVWETPGSGGFTLPHGSIYDAMKVNEISYGLFRDTEGTVEGGIAQVASLHNLSMLNVHTLNDLVADLQGDYSYQYTFIEPNYGDITSTYENGSSQHPIDGVHRGEQLIKTVYEAIRASSVWGRSLLIITYDEHGGFYDHFAPPAAHAPDDGSDSSGFNASGFLFDQLGVRVPAVIISPWIQAQVDHTVYDHSSVLKTLEKLLGLDPLTERDHNANDVLHLVGNTLRTDCPTTLGRPAPEPVKPPRTAAQQMIIDQQPLPPSGNQIGFLAIAVKTDIEMSGGTPAERAAILAKAQSIKTKGEARAYMQSVVTRAEALKATRRER
jgi:phospholipase C